MITDKSKFMLKEFPGYTCVLYDIPNHLTKQRIYNERVPVRPFYKYQEWSCHKQCCLIPRGYSGTVWKAKGKLEPGDRLTFHPKCDIPISLVTGYETVSSRSNALPTKLVIPMRGGDHYARKSAYYKLVSSAVLFKSEIDTTIIAIDVSYGTLDDITKKDYEELFKSSFALLCDTSRYHIVDNGTVYCIAHSVGDLDYAILTKMIPPDKLISEKDVPVNSEPMTYDILLSCYKLLQSPDVEVRNAALITIAQRDIRGYEELLQWLLHTFERTIGSMKSKNSAFRWVCLKTGDGCYIHKFREWNQIKMARRLLTELTERGVYWNEDGDPVLSNNRSLDVKPGLRNMYEALI